MRIAVVAENAGLGQHIADVLRELRGNTVAFASVDVLRHHLAILQQAGARLPELVVLAPRHPDDVIRLRWALLRCTAAVPFLVVAPDTDLDYLADGARAHLRPPFSTAAMLELVDGLLSPPPAPAPPLRAAR